MSEIEISMRVNGESHRMQVAPPILLVEALREQAGVRGVRTGCETGDCGACTVILDGAVTKSCLRLAALADGADVVTLEGLAEDGRLHPVQEAFVEEAAFQCGFCLPGMVMCTVELLREDPAPDAATVASRISGNLCRCTGYQRFVDAAMRCSHPADRTGTAVEP